MSEQEKHILVVDDSKTVRASLKKTLQDHYKVTEAVDGEDGWEKLQQNSDVLLVITDIMMPNLDGYGLICRIRGSDSLVNKKLPIIVVTSAEDDLTRERAHACGANNFIVKPVESSDLLERVNFHTEANLRGQLVDGDQMAKYDTNIENAVISAPDLSAALQLLNNGESGAVKPYAGDLAVQMIPLLEYFNATLQLELDEEINSYKDKLQAM